MAKTFFCYGCKSDRDLSLMRKSKGRPAYCLPCLDKIANLNGSNDGKPKTETVINPVAVNLSRIEEIRRSKELAMEVAEVWD